MKTSESSPEPNSNPLTSSAEASRARTSARLESEPGSRIQTARQLAAAFGLNSPALLGYFDPDGLSLKTSQACLFQEQSEELQEIWPDSGMWDAGSAYELQTSERPTSESASSSWPTIRSSSGGGNTSGYKGAPYRPALAQCAQTWPTARQEDGESCGNHPGVVDSLTGASRNWVTPQSATGGANSKRESRGSGGPDLMEQVEHWLTPHGMANEDKTGKKGGAGGGEFALQANNWQTPATDSFRSRGGDRKDEMGLDQQARMFPTPASRDYRTPNLKPGSERGMGTKGEQLQNFVEHHCPSLPDPQTPDGPQSSETDPTSLPPSVLPSKTDSESNNHSPGARLLKRRLNPRFVSWLMGFPVTWTEL